tara:strand:- start:532 stop:1527 length:996 start_codon:yes stop_codon:yes gene_type:complete
MTLNPFFEKKGPFPLKEIAKIIHCEGDFANIKDFEISGFESLSNATRNDMTFLNSSKYKDISLKTKAAACITTSNLSKFLPKECIKLDVKNTLFAVTLASRMFYPNADIDYPDKNLVDSNELKNLYKNVIFGKNVLVGKNVLIGDKTNIGSNTVIESNVKIGSNCVIGSFVSVKNSLIGSNVNIKDGAKIGNKGFGFIPIKDNNLRTPQIGKVILEDGVEIGSNCTIDRGSVTDTIICKNTFLDNQVHIAHNVKIGKNSILAGLVGVAGSTNLGNNVMIGGASGISGHLTIGNNVKIGGGSGVINDIGDDSRVMGYPAIPFKEFAIKRKKK